MKTYINQESQLLLRLCGVFLVATSFSSCLHMYYSPNSSNVPLFKEKGEGRFNAYYSSGNEVSGAEVQGAAAVGKHTGIIFNTAFLGHSENYNDGTKDEYNVFLVEGGAGYFNEIDKNVVFETYGGLGVGGATNNYFQGGSSKIGFTKFFIQPSIGYSVENVDFGIASKMSAVFMKVNNASRINDFDKYDIDYIKDNPTSFLWEPSVFVRFGFPTVKLQLQYTPSFNLNNKELSQEINFLSMGLSFTILPKKNAAKEK